MRLRRRALVPLNQSLGVVAAVAVYDEWDGIVLSLLDLRFLRR
jgi:hypothetical protein